MQEELARAELAEAMGYDDVWVPGRADPYCLAGDALLLTGETRRARSVSTSAPPS